MDKASASTAATTNNTQQDAAAATGGNPKDMVAPTARAMDAAVETNMRITQLTIAFQTAMQGINSIREAATEAYKKAGEANNSMHQ